MLLNLFFTLLLVAINAFFVAAEFALVKLRVSQLEPLIAQGDKKARLAKHLVESLDRYLSACQLGITLASLALGWIGEPVVVAMLVSFVNLLGFTPNPDIIHWVAVPIAFILITIFHIVLGEQAPKYLGIRKPRPTSLFIAYPLEIFYKIFRPFIWILNALSAAVMRLFGIAPGDGHEAVHSPQELLYILEESKEGGAIGLSEYNMLENVFDFYERPAHIIMVPRTSIIMIHEEASLEDAVELLLKEGVSRMPVYSQSADQIVGVVYEKDLLKALHEKRFLRVQEMMKPVYMIPENKKLGNLLRDMQSKRIHIAIIVDEFGGTAGLITLEDIIEELVGEIHDEYDKEPTSIVKISDNEFIVETKLNIIDANEVLPIPLPESNDYDTVNGYLYTLFGKIPTKGEVITTEYYDITITDTIRNKVTQVKMVCKPAENIN